MLVVNYVARLVDGELDRLIAGLPAVLVVGPRACGKTTSARRHAAEMLRLDRPADASATRADPDLALAVRGSPLLIDEWQLVPEVLGAVKRAVDDGHGPGRFLITGSSQTDLAAAGRPATGRVVRLPMWGLCRREISGDTSAPSVLDRIAATAWPASSAVTPAPDLADYVDMALRGGLPEASLQDDERLRRDWLASYVDEIITRDGALLDGGRDPIRLRRYLRSWAANTAGIPEHKTLYTAAGINRDTAVGYDRLLESLLVVDPLPAWSTNRLSRLTSAPKRHIVEPALLAPLLGIDRAAVLRDGNLLGRVIETFVVAQLRPEAVVAETAPRLHHLRQADGRHEIDVIAELADGRVIAFEVKAAAAVTRADARHLIWLRDQLGDRFVRGVVLHAGPHTFPIDDRVVAAPICALWS